METISFSFMLPKDSERASTTISSTTTKSRDQITKPVLLTRAGLARASIEPETMRFLGECSLDRSAGKLLHELHHDEFRSNIAYRNIYHILTFSFEGKILRQVSAFVISTEQEESFRV